MNLINLFTPKPVLSDQEVSRGQRLITLEGVASMGFGSITTSGLLAAFALALGASNLQIGVLAAVPFITQLLQLPFVPLVDRLKRRKVIAVGSWLVAQLLWLPIAAIPLLLGIPGGEAVSLLLGMMALRGMLSALCNTAWNGWVRDLVPQQVLGRFFSRRLAYSTVAAVVFGLGAALFADFWRQNSAPEHQVLGFTLALTAGALFLGMASPLIMALMPEPLMQSAPGGRSSLWGMLASPFRDRNFRQLLKFLFTWGIAANLAIPFFAVYMLQKLGLPLSWVMGLTVLSQLANIMFLRVWGPFLDRFGSKVILSLCASLYLLVIMGWVATSVSERPAAVLPLLATLHIFAGIAAAGVNLSVATIGLKLAPPGQATAYLAGASIATSLGSGVGPLLGGLFVDFFGTRSLSLAGFIPALAPQSPVLTVEGFNLLFAVAFLLGFMTLRFLQALKEEGAASEEVVMGELLSQTREYLRAVSSVPGLRFITHFPYSYVRYVPGLDVALGVTAYQVAFSARAAVDAANHSFELTADIAERVSHALSEMVEGMEELGEHGVDLARHATRGAMHAASEVADDVGHLARGAILGTLDALGKTPADPWDTLWAVSYGVVEGADEAGLDVAQAAVQAVESAGEAADRLGLSEEDARARATQGAIAAAENLHPEAAARVAEALSEEVSSVTYQPGGQSIPAAPRS